MVQAAVPLQAMSGSARLAKARERFLAAEPVGLTEVREPILTSWRRSRDWSVAADRIDLRYTRDPDPETLLARSAEPVLRTLHEQLDGQPISIILTDSSGLVLSRLTADHDLERHLDGVMLAPGFNYSEDLVGTNGIGTGVEFNRPEEYVRACRRTGGIVLAIGNDVVMMNDYARRILDPADQAALIGQAAEVLTRRSTGAVTADLPTGLRSRMYCRPVDSDTPYADGIVHVKLMETAPRPAATSGGRQGVKTSMFLPGLVGSGVLWTRACREAEVAYDSAEWLTLEGEPGVGKMALARAVHQRRNPAGRFHVIDAASATGNDWLATARSELQDSDGMLVIRHVDELNVKQVHALSSALQEARAARRQRALRVAVTLSRKNTRADLTKLLRVFPAT